MMKHITLQDEPYLEKWARLFRYQQSDQVVKKILASKDNIRLLDLGCGQDTLYKNYLEKNLLSSKEAEKLFYLGLDPLIKTGSKRVKKVDKGGYILHAKYESTAKKLSGKFELVVMFALLEHVDDPGDLLQHAFDLLAPGGTLLLTTPSHLAKPVLEFLSYQLGIISRREIEEHKNYFSRQNLIDLVSNLKTQPTKVHHHYFEFGLNNFLHLVK